MSNRPKRNADDTLSLTDQIELSGDENTNTSNIESMPTLPKKAKTTVSELSTSMQSVLGIMQKNLLVITAQMDGFGKQLAHQAGVNGKQIADWDKKMTEQGDKLKDSIGQQVREQITPLQTRLSQLESTAINRQSRPVLHDVTIIINNPK